MKKQIIITLIFLLTFGVSHSQSIDSLKIALSKAKHDTTRCFILNKLIESEFDDKVWPLYNQQLMDIALSNIESASGRWKDKYSAFYAGALSNEGILFDNQGNIPKALENYDKALKILERLDDKGGVATNLNNIAVIYQNQKDLPKALDYFNKSLKIREEIGDKEGIAVTLCNLSVLYPRIKQTPKAIESLKRAIKIMEEIGEKQGLAYAHNNLGSINYDHSNFSGATEHFIKSAQICTEIGDEKGHALAIRNLSTVYMHQKNYAEAKKYSDSALAISWRLGYPEDIASIESVAARIDSATGNYLSAFEHLKSYMHFKDSINSDNTRKAAYKSQIKFDYEKKEAVLKEQQDKDRIIIWSVVAGLILMMGFAILIFRSLQHNKKANRIIMAQKELVEEKNRIIEDKQKEIIDSIKYAQRIQKALIPNDKFFDKELKRLKK